MRLAIAVVAGMLVVPAVRADENDDKQAALVTQQKKAALEAWKSLEVGEAAQHETDHLLLVAPKAMEGRLKDAGALLEKSYAQAAALLFMPKEEVFPGKLTVHLLAEPRHLDSFIRRVEKRRLDDEEVFSLNVADEKLRVAVCPPRSKGQPELAAQAAQQVAAAVLQRKAGARVELPHWFQQGFGRATYYRLAPRDREVIAERKAAGKAVTANKLSVQDVWGGGLSGEEQGPLAAGTMDFLAYGAGKNKFPMLLEGLKPGENQQTRSMDQALQAAGLTLTQLNAPWKRFMLSN